MRLLVAQVPALARRSVPTPTVRLGTVDSFSGQGTAMVVLDGDPASVSVQVGVPGGVWPGQRVTILCYPPHGAVVLGVLGPVGGEHAWIAEWDVPHSLVVATDAPGWVLESPDVPGGWHADAGALVCDVPGWWMVTMACGFSSNSAGTTRAIGLRSSGIADDLNASQPAGASTSGFGASMGTGAMFRFDVGDEVTVEGRQDSGVDLGAFARVHLRWAGSLN